MNSAEKTGSVGRLYLSEQERATVAAVLAVQVPGRTFWAFGSRATGKNLKEFSDLDLAVDQQLSWTERARLSEAFDEAPLNFKVDVVELGMVDAEFRGRIEKDFVVMQAGTDAV